MKSSPVPPFLIHPRTFQIGGAKKRRAMHKYDQKAPAPKPWYYKDGTPLVRVAVKKAPESVEPPAKPDPTIRRAYYAKYHK